MKKTGMILGVLISGLMSVADAGVRDIGNGGNVLVCYGPKKKIQSIELYDYYEARTKRNIQIDLGSASLSMDEKVKLGLSRLRRLNPNREKLYLNWYANFFNEAAIIDGVDLVPVPDVGIGTIPKNCEVKQVAGQQAPVFPGDSRYVINGDLWKMMSEETKAGLILHELALREATLPPNSHTTSTATRYFHSQFASHALDNLTLRQYADLIALVNFHFMDAGGMIIPMLEGLPFFFDDNTLEKGSGCMSADSYWSEISVTYLFQGQNLDVFERCAEFFPSGQITSIREVSRFGKPVNFHNNFVEAEVTSGGMRFNENGTLRGAGSIDMKVVGLLRSGGFRLRISSFELFDDGKLSSANFDEGTYTRGDQTAKIGFNRLSVDMIEFYPNGNPKMFALLTPMSFPDLPTKGISFTGPIFFYETGIIKGADLAGPQTIKVFGIDVTMYENISFDQNGEFDHGYIYGSQKMSFATQDIVLKGGITNNGPTLSAVLSGNAQLKDNKGQVRKYYDGTAIEILPNGLINRVY